MRKSAALAVVALLAAPLAACEPVNRIEVVVVDTPPVWGLLTLCGRPQQPMLATKTGFELKVPADCRGVGRVDVIFGDSPPVACPIREVQPGVSAFYRFRIEGGACSIR